MFVEYNPKLKQRARMLRKEMTPEEKHLWYDFLRALEPRFLRQKPVGEYIADFYCSTCGLVIELDGAQHTEPDAMEYDKIRDAYMKNMGLTVLRFRNAEIRQDFNAVCRQILNAMGK